MSVFFFLSWELGVRVTEPLVLVFLNGLNLVNTLT